MNQEVLSEIVNQDYSSLTKNIEDFLNKQISQTNAKGLIIGLSGGIDSAVTFYLSSRVLKKNTLALLLPDSSVTPKIDTEDGLKLVDKLGIDYKLLDISPIINEYSKYLEPDKMALGNLRARIRANLLYYYANVKNYLVVGSSDKSEFLIGYFTKFGDSSADVLPIISLYKVQVRKIAQYLGVPDSIIRKKSSPQLWKGHIAEEEIGVPYEQIDSILYCLIDKKLSIDETISRTEIEQKTVEKIYELCKNSQHKRMEPARP